MADRRLVSSGASWEPVAGYSRAVRVGPWVSVSGTVAGLTDGVPVGGDDIAAQTRDAMAGVVRALERVGSGVADVVRTRMFVTDISRWREVAEVHREVFGDARPATSMVEVRALIDPALLVEVEADAYVAEGP